MDIGLIVALCVAITLTLVSGILAGLFGGMWWQARKTAEVWEKTYTHLREQLQIRNDTYNIGAPARERDHRVWGGKEDGPEVIHPLTRHQEQIVAPQQPDTPREAPREAPREVVRVQATLLNPPPPVQPSAAAQRAAGHIALEDDPLGPQIKR